MRYVVPALFAFLLSCPTGLPALDILSMAPTTVQPGDMVRLTGGPFLPEVMVLIGLENVTPSRVSEREITFFVPLLQEGEYILSIRQNGAKPQQTFTLKVTEKLPVILSINPVSLDECQLLETPRIEVEGEGFPPGSALLLDGNPAPSLWESPTRMTLPVLHLKGGTHQIQVITPRGARSLARAFFINDVPEIHSANQGEDRVNSYEVIIQGKNFLSGSTLLVDGASITRSGALPGQTGQVRTLDCETLIYVRYPYSRTPKPVTLQVVNPNGRQSNIFSISIP